MSDRYDPHRAHPDTVLAILQQLLDPAAMQSKPRFWELVDALRDECRLSPATDAELLSAAKAYFAKYVQPHTNVTKEWAVLERIGVEVTGANSGPSGAAAKESREDIAAPGGATSEPEQALACPGCGRPMARVGGPGAHRGWTCVNCNAAGDPEEDHPDACGCEETEALKAEVAALKEQLSAHRARNLDLGIHLSRVRKLARAPEVTGLFDQIDREP